MQSPTGTRWTRQLTRSLVHDEAVFQKASVAASTKEEEPLRALLEEDDILCQHAAIPLRQTTIKTEMDVTAQAIRLFYQVNHTINRHLQHGQVETSIDLVYKGGTIMRTDYRWTFQPYKVLEMKAPNLLSRADFEKATARTDSEERKKCAQAHLLDDGTRLGENGKIFTQQVNKYLRALGVKDGALSDWNHLAIFDMNDLDKDHSNPKLARYTWFEENGDTGDHERRKNYNDDTRFSSPSNDSILHVNQ